MSKSVYSIVLDDNVVSKVDEVAKKNNVNRSALINKILADSLNVVTPEKRYLDIYNLVNDIFSASTFSILQAPAENSMAVTSIMNFKYNPTIKYHVELYRYENEGNIGKLRIQLRTRNAPLLERLDCFFRLWALLEEKYLSPIIDHPITYQKDDTKFTRDLMIPKKKQGTKVLAKSVCNADDTANAIAEYIKGFDRIMKSWFDFSDDFRRAAVIAESEYTEFITKAYYII